MTLAFPRLGTSLRKLIVQRQEARGGALAHLYHLCSGHPSRQVPIGDAVANVSEKLNCDTETASSLVGDLIALGFLAERMLGLIALSAEGVMAVERVSYEQSMSATMGGADADL